MTASPMRTLRQNSGKPWCKIHGTHSRPPYSIPVNYPAILGYEEHSSPSYDTQQGTRTKQGTRGTRGNRNKGTKQDGYPHGDSSKMLGSSAKTPAPWSPPMMSKTGC